METDTTLSRREASLRSAATASLAGIALVQALELPSLYVQGRQLAVLSMAAMMVCIGLGWALAAAPESAGRQLWRLVAGASVLVMAGWVAPRAFAVPGLTRGRADWTALSGAVAVVLAVVCLVVAIVAARPTRASLRGLAIGLAVLVAMAPGVAVALVSVGPGQAGGETVLAARGHLHSHGSGESAIQFQSIDGGRGGRYVYRAVVPARRTPAGLGLILGMAFIFTYGAIAYMRRRIEPADASDSAEALALPGGLEGGLA